ncbi:hypothetical protein Taro_037427 [Colocasia esculenta]|uniref:Uncharacterized protein n=1 Tax=Colocasia esculenta TaxID=4460 RepID=A0A843WG81_COLES|nr:hypothetical protein [Colocasia esculenta]
MSQIKVHVQKEGTVLKGHTPRTCKKVTLNSRYKSTHAHNSHCWQRTAQQTATTTVRQRTPATASPYLKRVGGLSVPYQPEQQELQQAEAKLLYKVVKRETPTAEYYKAAKIEKHLDHNLGQAKRDSRRTSGRPRETRVSRHNTNISDLHEVRKEQPGVTPRDTKQPSENDVSPQARPPQTSTRSRAHKQNHPAPRTLHEVRELHLPVPPRRHQGTGYRSSSRVSTLDTPRDPAKRKTLNTAHEAKLT